MLARFFQWSSYLFHPLLLLWYMALWYAYCWPSAMSPLKGLYAVIYVGFYVVLLPLMFVLLLVWNRLIPNWHMPLAQHRQWPLLMLSVLLSYALAHGLQIHQVGTLYFFYLATLGSLLTATLASFWKRKPSLHSMALGGCLGYVWGLLQHQPGERTLDFILLLLLSGWVCSARLFQQAHSPKELIQGFAMGLIPAILLYPFWL